MCFNFEKVNGYSSNNRKIVAAVLTREIPWFQERICESTSGLFMCVLFREWDVEMLFLRKYKYFRKRLWKHYKSKKYIYTKKFYILFLISFSYKQMHFFLFSVLGFWFTIFFSKSFFSIIKKSSTFIAAFITFKALKSSEWI